jgi:hypothetical protein
VLLEPSDLGGRFSANEDELCVTMCLPDAGKDLEGQPAGGICVRLMAEVADEEDRVRPPAERVERALVGGQNERDAGCSSLQSIGESEAVALREDDGCVDPRGLPGVEASPGTLVQAVEHASDQPREVPEFASGPQASVMVDQDSWGIERSERLEENRRREELELDDIGPPGCRQGRQPCRGLLCPELARPDRHAPE